MTDAQWQAAGWNELLAALFPNGARSKAAKRKLRLAQCGVARLAWDKLPDDRCRRAVEAAEAFADGRATADELATARTAAGDVLRERLPTRESLFSGAADLLQAMTGGGPAGASPFAPLIQVIPQLFGSLGPPGGPPDGADPPWMAAIAERMRLTGSVYLVCTAAGDSVTLTSARGGMVQGAGLLGAEANERFAQVVRELFVNPADPVKFEKKWRTRAVVGLAEGVAADGGFDRLPVLADALEEAGCDDRRVLDHCRGPGPHLRGCWVVDGVLGK
jgi:hypothetical protein